MTVSSQISRNDYNGNGVTTSFPVTFRFLENTHLSVTRTVTATGVSTVLILNSLGPDGYSVTGAGQPSGGVVTTIAAPATGTVLTILRSVPVTQEIDYIANDPFPAESHERGLDKLTMISQQQGEQVTRSVRLPLTTTGVSVVLPPPVPNVVWGWNGTATAPVYYDLTAIAVAGVFTQAGAGAIVRPVQDRLREKISAKDFGAVGNNSADDTVALQNAINQAASIIAGTYGGAEVLVPAGGYLLSAALVVPLNKDIVIRGDGVGKTILRQTNATAHGIVFENDNFLSFGGGVRDLTIEAGAGLETSGFFGNGSTGTGIRMIRCNDNFAIENVNINNFTNGMEVLGCWYTRARNVRIIFCDAHGVLIDKAPDNTVGAGNLLEAAKISNNGYSGGVAGSIGYRIRASGGDLLKSTDATSFEKGFVADPRVGDSVLYFFGSQTLFDTCTGDGMTFDGTNGNVWSCHFYDGWSAFNSGHGISVVGANVKDVSFWGRVRENGLHGINLLAGGFFFKGGSIQHNSRLANNVSDGVNVAAGVSNWGIDDAIIGNDGTAGLTNQRYGLFVAAGAGDNFHYRNNRFIGNVTAPVSMGASGGNILSTGNWPFGTFSGLNSSTALVFASASGVTPAAGTTGFLGGPGYNAALNLVAWRANRNGVITNIQAVVDVAPGAGQTFTYTLMKNGVATGLTFTITGAASFTGASSAASVTMAPNDSFAIRLQTSAGAGLAAHGYSVKFE